MTRKITRAALIAAIYALLTIAFSFISFGGIQFRIAEAMTLLPIIMPEAVYGLFAGCLLANLLGGGMWLDVLAGSAATLLAAVLTRRFRRNTCLAAAMPVVINTLMVGPVVYCAYVHAPHTPFRWLPMLATCGSVALGEAAVCAVLGLPMLRALIKLGENGNIFFKKS